MRNSIIGYFEDIVQRCPDKVAFTDLDGSGVTFSQLRDRAMRVGRAVEEKVGFGGEVLIIAEKSVAAVAYMLGVLYAGCYYINLDAKLPQDRLRNILSRVDGKVMFADDFGRSLALEAGFDGEITDEALLPSADGRQPQGWRETIDTDPMFVVFTSGSTGVPKGVILSHRNVMDYIEAFADAVGITEDDVLGNQAPLDYIAAIRDVYLPLYRGASTVLLDPKLFMLPVKLFDTIEENGVTTLCWVASAVAIPVRLGYLDRKPLPACISKVIFTGSVLQPEVLEKWKAALPAARFVNHYGPTEITASCTYYFADGSETGDIPIGKPYNNTRILLVKDGAVLAKEESSAANPGEIYVCGTGVTMGYYKDPEKTKQYYVNDPSDRISERKAYKTGDLGWYDESGLLHFAGRIDRQIKHMGHRIELDEIEAVALRETAAIEACSCQYDREKEVLYLFYAGEATKRDISLAMRQKLPDYMIPRKIVQLDEMPKLPNGKINMSALKAMFQ